MIIEALTAFVNKFIDNDAYEAIACFILRRTSLNKVDKNGDTALHRVLKSSDYKTAALLIKCGADVNVANREGDTPLHVITVCGGIMPEYISFLIKHKADVNAVDKDRYTPLHRGVLRAFRRDEDGYYSFRAVGRNEYLAVTNQSIQYKKLSFKLICGDDPPHPGSRHQSKRTEYEN